MCAFIAILRLRDVQIYFWFYCIFSQLSSPKIHYSNIRSIDIDFSIYQTDRTKTYIDFRSRTVKLIEKLSILH